MSADAPSHAGADRSGASTSDYDEMLETLDVAIDEARHKLESGRIRDEEKERVRIKWVRALAYAVNVRRQVANDRDLEELAGEIDELKAARDMS